MAKTQKYGIKYPFSCENEDNLYVDLNDTFTEMVKSKVLHVLFTPKGQKIRDPKFGTDLIKFLFQPNDSTTLSDIKNSISTDIQRYVPEVTFEDITIEADPSDGTGTIVIVHYKINGSEEIISTAVKI